MVGGIDLAGTVAESKNPAFKPGDKVLVNGYGLSEAHWGGYAQKQRVKAEWLVRQPSAFSAKQAMAIGTAGYTAMLCVLALEDYGIKPDGREVLVTGSAGGVGSVAIALLAKLGHKVVASTGRPETHDYLKGLGAAECIDRATLAEKGAPLAKERFAAAVDSVGSQTLASALTQVAYGGAVAACGLAAGADLPATVLPFILRNVALLGVDSVQAPMAKRQRAWDRLAKDLDVKKLDAMTEVVPLAKAIELAPKILAGQVKGRVVVDVNA
jgi:putative YhdH/YhfP family quinone oxidoreductase